VEAGEYRYPHIWNIHWRITPVLIIIVAVTIGLLEFFPGDETHAFTHQFNVIEGTSLCMTVLTSVLATFVIGAQIYLSTAMNHQARKRYKHLMEIIIQSSALYSLSTLLSAIITLSVANSSVTKPVLIEAGQYTTTISSFSTVSSLSFLSMNLNLHFTISLDICPHSHGCSSSTVKSKSEWGAFNQHNMWVTGWSVKFIQCCPTASQQLRYWWLGRYSWVCTNRGSVILLWYDCDIILKGNTNG